MRYRGLVLSLLLVVLAGLAALGVQLLAIAEVERALTGRELRWVGREVGLGRILWTGIEREGVSIARVDLQLLPSPRALVEGGSLDLEALLEGDPPSGPSTDGGLGARLAGLAGIAVQARDIDLHWGEDALLLDLSGQLQPRVLLDGQGGFLREEDDGSWMGQLERDLELGPLSGPARIDGRCRPPGPACTVGLSMDKAVLEHPLLARGPLPPQPLRLSAEVDPGSIEAEGRLGRLPFRLSARRQEHLQGELELGLASLEAVLELFGEQVPEARRAEIGGELGATLRFEGPPWRILSLAPQARALSAEGVLSDPEALRGGSFTWRAPIAGGEWLPRTTGDGLAGWTPLLEAGLAPAAMIAAEDASFSSHPGYSLEAIAEAVKEHLESPEEPLRGGSTITQQLAKNLFLDPEDRTLARKLRELLYALELERRLRKERILELYINVVELGPGIYGVKDAADAYFIKRPDRLTPKEAAFLAAILPSPRRAWERAAAGRTPDGRIDGVLDNMARGGAISPSLAEAAKQAPLRIVPPPR